MLRHEEAQEERRSRRTRAASAAPGASRPGSSAPAPRCRRRRCTRRRGCCETTLSRTALPVCITRLAMRPAKSFWKNGQLWRTTCQWLCQRIRLVTPGTTRVVAHQAVEQQRERAADQHQRAMPSSIGRLLGQRRGAVGGFHQPHQAADEERDQRVDQRHRQAGGEHRREQPARLAHEVPVERQQALRRRGRRQGRRADAAFEEGEHQRGAPLGMRRAVPTSAVGRYAIVPARSVGPCRCILATVAVGDSTKEPHALPEPHRTCLLVGLFPAGPCRPGRNAGAVHAAESWLRQQGRRLGAQAIVEAQARHRVYGGAGRWPHRVAGQRRRLGFALCRAHQAGDGACPRP